MKQEPDQYPEEEQEEQEEQDDLYEHHRLVADKGQQPLRVDVFLSTFIRNLTRTRIKNASLAGCVRVNGDVVKASYKVKPGDAVSLLLPYPPSPDVSPENIPLEIAYEDAEVIVIDKPAGMVVHPGLGNWSGTLVHALLWHVEHLPHPDTDPHTLRPGLVHRLDKDTSGLMVVAKSEYALSHLSRQFFERTTDRLYYALVWGDVKEDAGTVTGNIGRSPKNRKVFMVYEDGSSGKHAVTHYTVLERYGFATLVQCKLETGRTHQIRVHMKYIGHTLFGDYFYGGDKVLAGEQTKKYKQFIQNCLEIMPRQALHAKTLGFEHPSTKERLFFDSELPEDFSQVLEKVRTYTISR